MVAEGVVVAEVVTDGVVVGCGGSLVPCCKKFKSRIQLTIQNLVQSRTFYYSSSTLASKLDILNAQLHL